MGWKVRWSVGFRLDVYEYLGWRNWVKVKRFLKDLEESLNSDPSTLSRLKRNPIILEFRWVRRRKGYVVLLPARKMRYRSTEYRLFYVVYEEIKRVWFIAFMPRTDTTYKKKTIR